MHGASTFSNKTKGRRVLPGTSSGMRSVDQTKIYTKMACSAHTPLMCTANQHQVCKRGSAPQRLSANPGGGSTKRKDSGNTVHALVAFENARMYDTLLEP